jgi:hypothetical protein
MAGTMRHISDSSAESMGANKNVKESTFEMAPLDGSPSPGNTNAPLVLNEANSFEHTAYSFSTKKKWAILTVVALCQTSMSTFASTQ